MRIVETDNFGGDYPDESFLLSSMNKESADKIADAINTYYGGPEFSRYWKVVTEWPGLEYVVAMHLSSNCINPTLARFELNSAIRDVVPGCEVVVSDQKKPTKMMVVM